MRVLVGLYLLLLCIVIKLDKRKSYESQAIEFHIQFSLNTGRFTLYNF